jgi:hypothetical protein
MSEITENKQSWCFACGCDNHNMLSCRDLKFGKTARTKKFLKKDVPVYVETQERSVGIVCRFCGETGHTEYSCSSEYNARNIETVPLFDY